MAASMSPLVTRPSLPVPGTAAASMPVSAAILRTDGANGISAPGALGAAAGFGGAGGGAACGAASAGFAGAFVGAAPAPSLIAPRSAPTATVSPSLTVTSVSTPAAGAGTSIVTLSVSSSTNGSSTATTSPGFLNHLPIVASVTDSPSAGTRISAMASLPLSRRHSPGHRRRMTSRYADQRSGCHRPSSGHAAPIYPSASSRKFLS